MARLFESEADRERALRGVLAGVDLPGLPAPQVGKVRQAYDLSDGRRLMVATDRLSAFDLQLTTVPYKGQVLTELSRFWFERTAAICPNHLVAVPDPNVTLCRRLRMLPVEVVVRGYLAGTTSTSLLTLYGAGARTLYGTAFPDGMRANQRLAAPVITPTTKGAHGAHDTPLRPADVTALGLVAPETWGKVCERALALFAFGQAHAARSGLILVDTKYEFGLDEAGEVVIADEMHTPDSSRYWDAATYEARFAAGEPPDAFDKDKVRRWVSARCDPYRDAIPPIPDALRIETAQVYATLFERLTGAPLVPPGGDAPAAERVAAAVEGWLRGGPGGT